MSNSELLVTPVGRLIMGSFTKGNDKDMHGKPKTDKAGNPVVEFYAGLAIEKSCPEIGGIISKLQDIAKQLWPQGQSQRQDFKWKIVDGDQQPREGSTGFWILNFTTYYAPSVYERGTTTLKTNGKRGDYYRIGFNVKTNGNERTPGLKLYMQIVEHVGYGKEIVSDGASPAVFLSAPASGYTPQGMSSTPTAPVSTALPQQQAQPFTAPTQQQSQPFAAPQQQSQPFVHPFLRPPQ